MDFEQAIKIELETITGLNGKVFPITAPEGISTPYLVYSMASTERGRELEVNHNGHTQPAYQLDVFHANYGNIKALKKSIIDLVETFWNRNIAGIGPYIQSVEIINDFEMYEEQVNQYHGVIEFRVAYQE